MRQLRPALFLVVAFRDVLFFDSRGLHQPLLAIHAKAAAPPLKRRELRLAKPGGVGESAITNWWAFTVRQLTDKWLWRTPSIPSVGWSSSPANMPMRPSG